MSNRITTPAPEVERDRWGRPLITPPGGGKPIPYTRVTTYVGCLEDTYNLSRWQQRMVALGLSQRPDLMLAVSSTDPDEKKKLNDLTEQAIEAAKGTAAATIGTALHALTERIDRGEELGVVPDAYIADLAAYQTTTSALNVESIETFGVLDDLKVAGTWDRIVTFNGQSYIADIKTGSIQWGTGKIAMQLAAYSRAHQYDPTTKQRTPLNVDQSQAIIIHLPAGQGVCELHWVDIASGWDAVQLAGQVRAWRARKNLTEPINTHQPSPTTPEPPAEVSPSATYTGAALLAAITTAPTVAELEALWADHHHRFTADHVEAAKHRKQSLTEVRS